MTRDLQFRLLAHAVAKLHIRRCLDANQPDKLDALYTIMGEVAEHWKIYNFIQDTKAKWERLRLTPA